MTAVDYPSGPPPRPAPKPASLARIEANRRNAQRSTGPRTDEGKRSSRANAVKHGLTARGGSGVELGAFAGADADRVARREALVAIHNVDDPWTRWAADMTAHASTQVDRAVRMIGTAIAEASARASSVETWAEDRALLVAEVHPRLEADPDGTVARLSLTPEGIDWMIGRWQILAIASEDQGGWTADQANEAFDLLRIPRDFRQGEPSESYHVWKGVVGPPISFAEIARREVARLDLLRAHAADHSEILRLATVAGESDASVPDLRRLRRYEAELLRKLRHFLGNVERKDLAQLDPRPAPEVVDDLEAPLPQAGPADATKPKPETNPIAPTAKPETNPIIPITKPETNPIVPASLDELATLRVVGPARPADAPRSRPDPDRLRKRKRRDRRRA